MNKNLLLILALLPFALAFWGYAVLYSPDTEPLEAQPTTPAVTDTQTPEVTSGTPETEPIPEETAPKLLGTYTVTKVTDGDTVVVSDGTEFLTVRVIGIDAPETIYAPDGAECFNTDATLEADRLLAGATVTLASDPTQDTFDDYNRLLAYITLPDGSDFGETMITGGFAEEYTFKGRAYLKQAAYQAAETAAQSSNTGLWGCE